MDTHQLGDDNWLRQYFKNQMSEIYWDLGYKEVRSDVLYKFVTGLGIG